jgi:ribulose-5-phosphate 4-epimerase/fuculose-1-phosphate aldolase
MALPTARYGCIVHLHNLASIALSIQEASQLQLSPFHEIRREHWATGGKLWSEA